MCGVRMAGVGVGLESVSAGSASSKLSTHLGYIVGVVREEGGVTRSTDELANLRVCEGERVVEHGL